MSRALCCWVALALAAWCLLAAAAAPIIGAAIRLADRGGPRPDGASTPPRERH